MNETLTVNDAAAALRVSRRTVYNRIESGYLAVEQVQIPVGTQGGWQTATRVRCDSPAFRVKPEHRRKTDPRTAWRLAAAARKVAAA